MKYQPTPDYKSEDAVMTPDWLAEKIATYFLQQTDKNTRILEPCKGDGAFLKYLPNTTQWCEIKEGRDFMEFNSNVDWIITNPPWSKIRDFLRKGFEVSDNIVYLFTINHLWTKARLRMMKEANFGIKEIILLPSVSEFPQTGFQLGVVHLARGYKGQIQLTDWT